MRKKCSSDREKEFAKILRSLEQFIQTEKCQNTIGIHMYWKNIGIQKHAGKVSKLIFSICMT